MPLPTVLDVYQARRRIGIRIPPTPLAWSPWLSSMTGGAVYLKNESGNLTRSFKIRGALNAALKLTESVDGDAPRLVTASAGNHGRALALAAEQLGVPCVVFTPAAAPETKRAAIQLHGADLHAACEDYDAAERDARAFAGAGGGIYVSPYNNRDVIAGAGTIGLELVEAMPRFDVVVVPLGGGGLASGVGLAVRAAAPLATIIGVEVDASAPFTASLRAGRIVEIVPKPSLADGLVGNLEPGSITFPLVQRVIDRVITVSEVEVAAAMKGLAAEEKLVVEGAGAAAVAAIMSGKAGAAGRTAIALVTGGNVDLSQWLKVIA
jgi:threonine dehydratase